jgi:hypothetical protein
MSKLLNTSEIINTINSQIDIKPQALDKTFVINVIALKIRKKVTKFRLVSDED